MTNPGLVVLAGGGHSHALVLKKWAMRPNQRPARSIILVNRNSTTLYSGMVPGHIAGLYEREEMAIDLRALSERAGVAFAEAEITGVDPLEKLLHLRGRPSLHYSLLSLDVGAVSRCSAEGVAIKPLEPALAYLAKQSQEDQQPFRVIGAGAAGVEVALALRKRWPKRRLQLQKRDGQLSNALVHLMRKSRIELVNDKTPWEGPSLLCTGSRGPDWLKESGLPVNCEGRVRTDGFLRVEGIEGLFASGDCAVISGAYRPASGVWAVRAAKPLSKNLEASCRGESLVRWRPQKRALQLIGTSEETAWAQWWRWRSPAISKMWQWKEQIDRQFMAGFSSSEMEKQEPMACRGCAAKIAAEPLCAALDRANLLGPIEDAAEIVKGQKVWLQSVDGFPAIVSDPWLNGRLTTLHACSDLWSTGADVRSAMATVTMPMINKAEQEEWLVQTLAGIKSVLEEQGAVLLGGHSMETRSEPPTPTSLGIEIAMTINGATTKPWRKSGIKPGDKLLLSRPLGTGILFAGAMRGATSPKHMDDAINEMNKNQKGLVDETRMLAATVNACTDITGFGLLGHLGEMISDQPNISIELNGRAIPKYEGVMELLSQGVKSTLSPANQASWKWLDKRIKINGEVSAGMLELLVDPQTCGPILIACDESTAKRLEETKKWRIIGEAKGDSDRSEQCY